MNVVQYTLCSHSTRCSVYSDIILLVVRQGRQFPEGLPLVKLVCHLQSQRKPGYGPGTEGDQEGRGGEREEGGMEEEGHVLKK